MEAPPFSSRTLKEKSKLHQVHIKKKTDTMVFEGLA